jgi:hypothetical protein
MGTSSVDLLNGDLCKIVCQFETSAEVTGKSFDFARYHRQNTAPEGQ